MSEFVRVAAKSEIPTGRGRLFEVAGKQIALFNVAGSYFAIANACEHQGGPLAEGDLEGCVVTCPWHGWTYDVTTGLSPDDADARLECFAVRVEGDDVLISV